jgi:hypothetical protein
MVSIVRSNDRSWEGGSLVPAVACSDDHEFVKERKGRKKLVVTKFHKGIHPGV